MVSLPPFETVPIHGDDERVAVAGLKLLGVCRVGPPVSFELKRRRDGLAFFAVVEVEDGVAWVSEHFPDKAALAVAISREADDVRRALDLDGGAVELRHDTASLVMRSILSEAAELLIPDEDNDSLGEFFEYDDGTFLAVLRNKAGDEILRAPGDSAAESIRSALSLLRFAGEKWGAA
jgi:hypothetical protein